MDNRGAEEHIALLQAVHDSLDLETVQELIRNGDFGGPGALRSEWVAGPGMLSPGRTGATTVHLEPGDYDWIAEYSTNTQAEPHLEELGWLKTFNVKP